MLISTKSEIPIRKLVFTLYIFFSAFSFSLFFWGIFRIKKIFIATFFLVCASSILKGGKPFFIYEKLSDIIRSNPHLLLEYIYHNIKNLPFDIIFNILPDVFSFFDIFSFSYLIQELDEVSLMTKIIFFLEILMTLLILIRNDFFKKCRLGERVIKTAKLISLRFLEFVYVTKIFSLFFEEAGTFAIIKYFEIYSRIYTVAFFLLVSLIFFCIPPIMLIPYIWVFSLSKLNFGVMLFIPAIIAFSENLKNPLFFILSFLSVEGILYLVEFPEMTKPFVYFTPVLIYFFVQFSNGGIFFKNPPPIIKWTSRAFTFILLFALPKLLTEPFPFVFASIVIWAFSYYILHISAGMIVLGILLQIAEFIHNFISVKKLKPELKKSP